ncbi:MAG: PKD domain-containing protein [Bacteroidia bacterium]
MKKALLFLFLLFSTAVICSAQYYEGPAAARIVPGAEAVRYSEHTKQLQYIRFGPNGPASLDQLLEKRKPWMPQVNGKVTWQQNSAFEDELGIMHRRMQMVVEGMPVEGAILILHEAQGRLQALNGDLYSFDVTGTQPAVSKAQAINLALAEVGAERYMWENGGMKSRFDAARLRYLPKPELVWAPVGNRYKNNNFRLAWKMDVYAMKPLSRQWVFIDAMTGKLVSTQNRIHTVDVVGSAQTLYSGTRSLTTDQTGPANYRLRETGRGGGINTYNCQTGTDYMLAVDFTDANNVWNNVNPQQDECAPDAHIGTEATFDYYHLTYGWDSYDDNNSPMNSYVHYDVAFGNAFWDGQVMTYGDGDGSLFNSPLTTFDVCGHEITHGVTEHSAGLVYFDEPGGLNEGFSDIFGKAVEHYARPTQTSWLVGPECSFGLGIRDMANPNNFQNPDTYGGLYWQPGLDPHYSSAIPNKWFYILVMGESGTNDLNNAYNVTGLGYVKAEAIAFRTLTTYLTPNSQFSDARFYAIQSATDLYGACTTEMINTANAWYAVGVGGPWTNTPQALFSAYPRNHCMTPATVSFTNTSNGGASYYWDFGDGTTSTSTNPQHVYNNLGTYNVKLVATGCTGAKDSVIQNNYIVVDTNLACTVTLPTSGNTTLSYCVGNVLDPGGPNDYMDNCNTVVTIQPPLADYIVLTFNSFAIEDGWDFLNIYDGPTTASPLIGSYTGITLPGGGTVSSTTGAVTLEFTSDVSVTMSGFDIDFECFTVTTPPVANFTGTPFTTCNGIVNFEDLSTNLPFGWTWSFGDGGTSSQQDPIHQYSQPGTYSVSLIACNNLGCDTIVMPNIVVYNPNSQACQVTTFPTQGTYTATMCAGTLMDDGGQGNYSDNVTSTVFIAPPGASRVELTFNSFDLETGWDFLTIYDGPSNLSPMSGSYTGQTRPNNGQTIVSTGGALTIEFMSDFVVNAAGFDAFWRAIGASGGPNALFTAPVSANVAQTVNFTDQSIAATTWAWDFDDGSTSTLQNPTHAFSSAGVYHVLLRATDSTGCADEYIQNIYVGIVGTDPGAGMTLDLWPNPARDRVHVDLRLSLESPLRLRLMNALGQQVWTDELPATSHLERVLDVAAFAKGVYFLRIETETGAVTRKISLN